MADFPAEPRIAEPGDRDLLAEVPRDDIRDEAIEPLSLARGAVGTRIAPARWKRLRNPPSAAHEEPREGGEPDGDRCRIRRDGRECHRRPGMLERPHAGEWSERLRPLDIVVRRELVKER
jgi:hypothetical protein